MWPIFAAILVVFVVLAVVLIPRGEKSPPVAERGTEPTADTVESRSAPTPAPRVSPAIPPSATPSPAAPVVAALIKVSGTVTSRVTGRPIPGATVLLQETSNARSIAPDAGQIRTNQSLETAEDGTYSLEFEALPPTADTHLSVRITAPGYAAVSASFGSWMTATDIRGDAVLEPGRAMHGMVRRAGGEPVADVVVSVVQSRQGMRLNQAELTFNVSDHATSGADGRFLLSGIHENGPWRASARMNFGTTFTRVFPVETDFMEIVLPGMHETVTVTVLSHDDLPMMGVRVWVSSSELEGQPEGTQFTRNGDNTDPRGVSRLEGIPAGKYNVTASIIHTANSSPTSASEITTVEAGTDNHVTIKMPAPVTVSGRVIDAHTERPIPNVPISLTPIRLGTDPPVSAVYTDGEGRFSITGHPQSGPLGEYVYTRAPEGYRLDETGQRYMGLGGISYQLNPETRTANNVEIRMVPGVAVRGRVVWKDGGAPVPSQHVSAWGSGLAGVVPTGMTDNQGQFSITVVAGYTYRFEAQAQGGFARQEVEVVPDKPVDEVVLELDAGGVVRGTVTNTDKEPVSGARVEWHRSERSIFGVPNSVLTGTNGEYELTGAGPGEILVGVNPPEGSAYSMPDQKGVSIQSGEVIDRVDFELPVGEDLIGIVVDQDGEPVAGANVTWYLSTRGAGLNRNRSVQTAEDGTFTISGLAPDVPISQVFASREGYSNAYRQNYTALDGELKLVMNKLATLSIQAVYTGSGTPVPHYEYLIYENAWQEWSAQGASVRVSNPDGIAQIDNVNRGGKRVVIVEVDAAGEATGLKGSALFSAELRSTEPVRVELHRPFEISGRVVGSDGEEPIEGARVFVEVEPRYMGYVPPQGAGRRHAGFRFKNTLTDSRGRFTLEGFTHGTFSIAADVEGRASRVAETVVIQPGVSIPEVVLHLNPPSGISVTAMGCDNTPMSGGRLLLMNPTANQEVMLGPDGKHTFQGLTSGRYSIQYIPPGNMGVTNRVEAVELAEGEMAELVFDMCAPYRVSGRYTIDGAPGTTMTGVSVGFQRRGSAFFNTQFTISQPGEYSAQLSEGTWDLMVSLELGSLRIPISTLDISGEQTEITYDVDIRFAPVDLIFEYTGDLPRGQGSIDFVRVGMEEAPRNSGRLLIAESDERRHLPRIPEGEYVVHYSSFSSLLAGKSDPTPVVQGEVNVIFIDIKPADGDRARVAEAQSLLRAAGYDPGPIDGLMGPMTAGAIRNYERAKGLSITGEVSDTLLQSLRGN